MESIIRETSVLKCCRKIFSELSPTLFILLSVIRIIQSNLHSYVRPDCCPTGLQNIIQQSAFRSLTGILIMSSSLYHLCLLLSGELFTCPSVATSGLCKAVNR